MPVSLNPKDFIMGGLPLDDVDVVVVDGQFTTSVPSQAYEAKAGGTRQVFCKLSMRILSPSGGNEVHDNYWSCGSSDQYVPNVNNPRVLESVSGKRSINQQSNFAIFLSSLQAHGFPMERLSGGDITPLIGTKMHVAYQEQPERRGLSAENRPVLVCTKIISLPEEDKAVKSSSPSAEADKGYLSPEYSDLAGMVADELSRAPGRAMMMMSIWARFSHHLAGKPNVQKLSSALRDPQFYIANGFIVDGSLVRMP